MKNKMKNFVLNKLSFVLTSVIISLVATTFMSSACTWGGYEPKAPKGFEC